MNRRVEIALWMACLCFASTLALAEEPCSLDTFTGTYVFFEKGSSSIFDPTSAPYPLHWEGAYAPFVTIGQTTMAPDGTGEGQFWIRVGSFNGGLEPIPVEVEVLEMNEDCTGKFSAQFVMGGQAETIIERFILFDSGREFRAIPIEGGAPTLAWIMEGHRISRPGEPLGNCGQQTAKGRYLWTAENLLRFDLPDPLLAQVNLLKIEVEMSGEYKGVMYEKLGPMGGIELPISGKIKVNPDCTFSQDLVVTIGGVTYTDPLRGVFFDQGKRGFGLSVNTESIGIQFSFGQLMRIGE